jgi:uncharacterized membrane protein
MAVTPPAFRTDRAAVFDWAERGVIAPERLAEALAATGITPGARDWREFLDTFLLWTGAASIGAGAIFFIAANWDALGRFARFGLVELFLVLAVLAAWRLGIDRVSGKAALLVATLATGGLLALFGQTYQTGADPFELFANWALLVLPWVVVARFAALWMLWLVIMNLAVAMYFQVRPNFLGIVMTSENQAWALFALNTLAWAVWDVLRRRLAWLDESWAIRVLATASGVLITGLSVVRMLDTQLDAFTALVHVLWLAAVYVVYRRLTRDLFMVAGACLSAIITVSVVMTDTLADGGGDSVPLLIGLVVIGMTAAAASWLRRIAAEPIA